jgi:hypothetical protein
MNRKPIIIAVVAAAVLLIIGLAFRSSKNVPVIDPATTASSTAVASDIQTVDENSSLYDDPGNRFTFVYPKNLTVTGPVSAKTTMWRQNATTTGNLLATIVVPKSYMPGTNFSETKFTVGVSNDKAELGGSGCPTGINFAEGSGDAIAVTIHNQTYTKITRSEGAAGNVYQTTSYFTVRGGSCYALEYTIHSTNIANYPASQGIKEFDKAKIETMFDNLIKTFIFTIKSE